MTSTSPDSNSFRKSKTNDLDGLNPEIKKLIRRAENEIMHLEKKASMAEALAGKLQLTVKGHLYYIETSSEAIKRLSSDAENESNALHIYKEKQAIAAAANRKALNKKKEANAAQKHMNDLAKTMKAKIKAVEASYEKEKIMTEVKNAETEAVKIVEEASVLDEELKKAKAEEKKAKLEAEKAIEAKISIERHKKIIIINSSALKISQTELENRQAEAKARRNQALEKKSEIKALRAGDLDGAEANRAKARGYRTEAIAKNKEIQTGKTKRKKSKETEPPSPIAVKQARLNEKKYMSANGLLKIVYEAFQKSTLESTDLDQSENKEANESQNTNSGQDKISDTDCLMSALAIFSLKYSSLLQFNKDSREGGCISQNLKNLYKVKRVPSDTYMRERLDEIDPVCLRPAFKSIFAKFQRSNELEKYVFMDGLYLLLTDGVQYFSSKKVYCKKCCQKHHQDGSKTYHHQMLAGAIASPDYPTVIPVCPEPIDNKDGSTKNDCESNAYERFLRDIRREHPHLPLVVSADALTSNGPFIQLLKNEEVDMRFILVVKPDGNNKSLFEHIETIKLEERVEIAGEHTYKIKFTNDVPLNGSYPNISVNYFEVYEYNKNGELTYHNSWITDITITPQNVYRLVQGGRAKWKIENETFNTLKNQGYQFERNFGHGYKNLSVVFALLMFLAFLIDQVQQSSCGLFQEALRKAGSKKRLWRLMEAYFVSHYISSWVQLFEGIIYGIEEGPLIPCRPVPNTS